MSPFLAWGDFHARSRFARSTVPEEKWGTTRSLKGFHCRWEMDGWNRSTGVGGFNSPLKREPAMLTTLESFSYMVYFAFLIFVSKREG